MKHRSLVLLLLLTAAAFLLFHTVGWSESEDAEAFVLAEYRPAGETPVRAAYLLTEAAGTNGSLIYEAEMADGSIHLVRVEVLFHKRSGIGRTRIGPDFRICGLSRVENELPYRLAGTSPYHKP